MTDASTAEYTRLEKEFDDLQDTYLKLRDASAAEETRLNGIIKTNTQDHDNREWEHKLIWDVLYKDEERGVQPQTTQEERGDGGVAQEGTTEATHGLMEAGAPK